MAGKGKKRKSPATDYCNLCNLDKKSAMVKCNTCEQWQHFKCAKINMKDYNGDHKCISCAN